jgi:photosystem II stability/assembly factor-like uncharacterized protein
MSLLAIAKAGLFLLGNHGGWRSTLLRSDPALQCVACDSADPSSIYTGSRGGGVQKSEDGGRTWRNLQLPANDVFSLAVSPADGSVYAGTEPSQLFKSSDEGKSWRELTALTRIPSAPTWSFPPRPWTSHVRAIAPSPHDAGLLLAGIELGGLMRSEDGGQTWADHAPGAQRDVHALAWHPGFAERAYEAGGGGAAWSHDGGRTWEPADAGRDRHYTWALAVDPEDPDLWYVSASPSARHAHGGENAQAHIYRWRGEGPWEEVRNGLPQPLNVMPYALIATHEELFAGLADGRIFSSANEGESWTPLNVSGPMPQGLKAFAISAQD